MIHCMLTYVIVDISNNILSISIIDLREMKCFNDKRLFSSKMSVERTVYDIKCTSSRL